MQRITSIIGITTILLITGSFANLDAVELENIGFKVGWNTSTLSATYKPGWRSTVSFGGTVDMGFNDWFGLQIELLSVSGGYENNEALLSVDYVQLPLLGKFSLMRQNKLTIEFLVGPAISKKQNQSYLDKSFVPNEGRNGSLSKQGLYFSEGGTFFFNYDKAIIGGLDFEIKLLFGQIVISPRYYWGLTVQAGGEKNRIFSLLVGYGLGM